MNQIDKLHNRTTTIPYPLEPRSMLHWSKACGKNFGNNIRDHINGIATKAYWEKRRELTDGIWNKRIDWELIA